MLPPPKNVSNWLAKLACDLTEEGVITKFELWHSVEGEGGERLVTMPTDDRPEGEGSEEIMMELWTEAVQDSETRMEGSNQRYVIRAFRGDGVIAEDSKSFILPGQNVTSLTGGSTEPPTPRGMLSQEMRQNDNLHAMVIRLAEASAGSLASQLHGERQENDQLREKCRRGLELEQELLDRQHERDEARASREKRDERVDSLLTMACTMAPAILNRLLAAPGAPTTAAITAETGAPNLHAAAARDAGIAKLFESLEAEQVQTILSVMSPEQSIGLMELYESYREDNSRAAAAKSAAASQQTAEQASGEETHGSN